MDTVFIVVYRCVYLVYRNRWASVLKKRTKKYNPIKIAKLQGRGAEFGAMSNDLDENGKMVTRCNHKKITLNELQALRQSRKWNVLVAVFLEDQFGKQYQENAESEFKTEHGLEWIVDNYIDDIQSDLMKNINPNHFKYWGWHAEAL